jgi:hypothetical protein
MTASGKEGLVKFADLPADCFPFTIELLDPATGETLWTSPRLDGPGAIWIPPARDLGVEKVASRVTFADGTVEESGREKGTP